MLGKLFALGLAINRVGKQFLTLIHFRGMTSLSAEFL